MSPFHTTSTRVLLQPSNMSKTDTYMKIYELFASSDVKKFFFSFENVVTRGKTDKERESKLLLHMYDKAFDFYYTKLAEKGGIN